MSSQIKKPLLDVAHLSKSFPVKQNFRDMIGGKGQNCVKAVDDVSFSVYEGETLGLVGESGCGKSTLSKTLIRLYSPDSGSIVFGDYGNIARKEGKELIKVRSDMQMVFQDPYSSLNPKMTIRQCFYEILSVHQICPRHEFEKRTVEMLELVGMPSYTIDRYPADFSGGQRQRIGIARALIIKPAFLIADEPVSALDVSIQAQIINLLIDLKKKLNLTMLFISHELNVVQYLADRVMVMHMGKVVEMGKTEELFRHPGHPYTQLLLQSVPDIDVYRKEMDEFHA